MQAIDLPLFSLPLLAEPLVTSILLLSALLTARLFLIRAVRNKSEILSRDQRRWISRIKTAS